MDDEMKELLDENERLARAAAASEDRLIGTIREEQQRQQGKH